MDVFRRHRDAIRRKTKTGHRRLACTRVPGRVAPSVCQILPSQRQAMRLFSMAEPPEDRDHFKERFHAFATGKETSPCPLTGMTGKVCNTKAAWIAAAYNCNFVHLLQCAGDMFPFSKMESCFLSKIYIMDVILNRLPLMKTEACAKLPSRYERFPYHELPRLVPGRPIL